MDTAVSASTRETRAVTLIECLTEAGITVPEQELYMIRFLSGWATEEVAVICRWLMVAAKRCPNNWHDSAPARARHLQRCPECPPRYEGR